MGRGEIQLFKRDRRQVRALPHHLMVRPPNSAWQPPYFLQYQIQRMLAHQM